MSINYEKLLKELKKRGITSFTFRKNRIISQGTWTRIVNGEDIRLSTINDLSNYLNINVLELLEWIPDEKQD